MSYESPAVALDRLTAEDPHRAAITVLEHTWTRADIQGFATRTANRLLELGVRRGDRVAAVRRNAALHLLLTAAASRIGAVVVPVNFRLPASEVARVLADSTPAVVICGPKHADEFDAVLHLFGPTIWVVDDMDPTTDPVSATLSGAWTRYSELPGGEHDRPVPPPLDVGADDLLMLQYTSGSTGAPKGVRMSYGNVWASWDNFIRTLPLGRPDDVCLAVAPFGHVGGLNTFALQVFCAGGKVVVQRQFDVGSALELIERESVTCTFGVPTMYEAMARHPDFATRDLSSLRVALVGGATAPAALLSTFLDRGVPLCNTWGMTETTGGGISLVPSDAADHLGSVGRALPNTQVRLVDPETGVDVPEGRVGEVWVRGGNVTSGYWGMVSDESLGFTHGGWLRTGDLADRDAAGYVHLRGRMKDMIISGGENIYPAEVEREIATHPDVAEVAVVGVPDARWGESPMAFVVLKTGRSRLSLDALRGYLTGRLARYKLPRHLHLLDALPTGATGKIDTRALAAMAAASHDPGEPWDFGADPS